MRQHLYFLAHELLRIDSDIPAVMTLWNAPERKYPMIVDMLKHSAELNEKIENDNECFMYAKRVLDHINARPWMHHLWGCHDTHFHTNFKQFVDCPITSLNEIAEVVTKITQELYNA